MSELSVDSLSGSSGLTVTIKTGHTLTLIEDLDAGTAKLTNVGEPSASSDAATKNYVDTQLLTLDTIGELTDVTISSVSDNEVLAYDAATSEFINQTASEAGLVTSGDLASYALSSDLTTHTSDTTNPHSVTATQVGALEPSDIQDDDTFASASATDIASSESIKAYVDAQVATKDDLSELSGDSDSITQGSTNLYYSSALFDTDLGTKTTDDLTEGSTNLYYADSLVELYLTGGNGISYSSGTIGVDINGATDGTSITVDLANDLVLLYDADAGSVKKVKANQVGGGGAAFSEFLLIGA